MVKEEEETAMHSTMVMFSSSDGFTLKQVGLPFILVPEGPRFLEAAWGVLSQRLGEGVGGSFPGESTTRERGCSVYI